MDPCVGRIILVDPEGGPRDVLARRLRAQGYVVDEASDPAVGADMALSAPPQALIAELWMPGISGFQLCRLLRSEPATADLPVIVVSDSDEPRNRFWADRAGATAYVHKRRTGELVRALDQAIRESPRRDDFFFQLSDGKVDVRDRIARQLDTALFEAVLASEVRALATCGSFERLFDLFVQFLSQVTRYRWLAVTTNAPMRLAVHHAPGMSEEVEGEVRQAFDLSHDFDVLHIEDEDAVTASESAPPVIRSIAFGHGSVGQIALSPCATTQLDVGWLASRIAQELGGPIRMTTLVEESQRLAATDSLTGLMNRRSFSAALENEMARSRRHGYPLSLALLDVDHFKLVNDNRGHIAGDQVLSALGSLLKSHVLRSTDLAGRWGGEEFLVAYLSTDSAGAMLATQRLRAAVEALVVKDDRGTIPITISIGVTELVHGDNLEGLVERADQAMYRSKTSGRNCVTLGEGPVRAVREVA